MFDIGFWELALIGVVALLVVGPERLPELARTVGKWVGRIRRYVTAVRDDIEREIRAEELKELMEKSKRSNPLSDITEETGGAIGALRKQLEGVEKDGAQSERAAPERRRKAGAETADAEAEPKATAPTPADDAGTAEGPDPASAADTVARAVSSPGDGARADADDAADAAPASSTAGGEVESSVTGDADEAEDHERRSR
jgi:sec-independent protein translocase protein TatB